jgi:hypothetical protein
VDETPGEELVDEGVGIERGINGGSGEKDVKFDSKKIKKIGIDIKIFMKM